jgi:P-type Ca2+ transporter type 2C
LRPEVPAAIRACRDAGIAIKVVTGDHPDTARAIAREAGLDGDGSVVTGDELARASTAAQADLIAHARILSRIAPGQKHLIVDTLARQGQVVAMTGDGINDAPALKRADIGVSMGQRGTEVARAAADLVLLNDDFASIVAAIREGRKIFRDIQRAFLYLLGFHIPIVGLALVPPLLGLPLLLLPVHFVWLELIVHPVSALLFQGDPAPPELMRQPPRDPRAPMLPKAAVVRSAAAGTLLTAGVLLVYVATLGRGAAPARTVALVALVVGYQLLALVERTGAGWTWRSLFPRSLGFWTVWCGGTLSLLVLMLVPATAAILDITPLAPADWLLGAGVAVATVAWRLFAPAMPTS